MLQSSTISVSDGDELAPGQLQRLQEWFSGYCRGFFTGEPEHDRNFALKEEHTAAVAANMAAICARTGLPAGTTRLATAVAWLHDVGRFEQYRRYRTFRDSDSENHATLGLQVLAAQGVLADWPASATRLLRQAIALHNILALPTGVASDVRLLAELIRDADKLDIWRVFTELYRQPPEEWASAATLGFPREGGCSPAVLASLSRGEVVPLVLVQTLADFQLLQVSWLFDLNLPATFAILAERGYIEDLTAQLPDTAECRAALVAPLTRLRQQAERLAPQGGC